MPSGRNSLALRSTPASSMARPRQRPATNGGAPAATSVAVARGRPKMELTMTTVFANARILDGTGAKPYAGDVVVDGNTIVDVLPAGQRRPVANADTVDCGGATLMPGLIEPHAHLSFVDPP